LVLDCLEKGKSLTSQYMLIESDIELRHHVR
jgi:hypothetical protein